MVRRQRSHHFRALPLEALFQEERYDAKSWHLRLATSHNPTQGLNLNLTSRYAHTMDMYSAHVLLTLPSPQVYGSLQRDFQQTLMVMPTNKAVERCTNLVAQVGHSFAFPRGKGSVPLVSICQGKCKEESPVPQHKGSQIMRSLPPRETPHLVVVLTIATIVALAYCACAATVLSVRKRCTAQKPPHDQQTQQDELSKFEDLP